MKNLNLKRGSAVPLVVIVGAVLVITGLIVWSTSGLRNDSGSEQAADNSNYGNFPTSEDNVALVAEGNQAPTKTATIELESGVEADGESTVPVKVYFNAQEPISGVALRLTYPVSGNLVNVSNLIMSPQLLAGNGWSCPVGDSSNENGKLVVDLVCFNTSLQGYSAAGETLLASFDLVNNGGVFAENIKFTVDQAQSVVARKSDGKNVLAETSGAVSVK